MDGTYRGGEWMSNEGRQDRWRRGGMNGGDCLVISSHSLLSGAVVRWLAGHPEGLRACAGPLTRRHSGPGYHLGCSDRSS